MEIEYNKIFFKPQRRPSKYYLLIGLPFYMYRIETNEFSHGLNFFQKAILKLKSKPGIRNEKIAEFLNLDPKLIEIIVGELTEKRLINEHSSLTESGKEKLKEIDGLVINSGKKSIGYVFKFIDKDKFYPSYVQKVWPADILEESGKRFPKLVTGSKGDNDYTELPFFMDTILKRKINIPSPTEHEILNLIEKLNKKHEPEHLQETNIAKLSYQLSLRVINEQPEIIWACTYIYLKPLKDDTYDPDWSITDPFIGAGNNISLKFYLQTPENNNLLDTISNRFSSVITLGGKVLSEYQELISKLIEVKLKGDFLFGIRTLDSNLQQYIEAIIRNYVLLQNLDYNDIDASLSFSLNLQNSLETIFKLDKEKRHSIYSLVYQNLDKDFYSKKNSLIAIYRQKLFGNETQVPLGIINTVKGNLEKGSSLLAYLASFILAYNYDNKSPLYKILKNRIETIIAIARLRNEKGHGQTAKENILRPLTKEEVERYYLFIKSFINELIQNQ